jgi:hypothetical protein
MKTSWRVGLSGALCSWLLACGGGPVVCEKADALDLSKKAGDCTGLELAKPFGTHAVCGEKVKPCTKAEQDTLQSMVVCLENLSACTAATKDAFVARQTACYASAPSLSEACRVSVFGQSVPGQDGGADAGPAVDAGRPPAGPGAGAVDLIAVADETGFAFAWSTRQSATVAKWELNIFEESGDGGRVPEIYITPGSARSFEIAAGPMVARRYYLAGVENDLKLVYGSAPDAGMVVSDAGMTCLVATDCPPNRVCDLGQCQKQSCQPGGAATCPAGYDCFASDMLCNRQFSDAGSLDAGGSSDGGSFVSLPLLSESVIAKTGTPGLLADGGHEFPSYAVGGFSARRPELVAADSARQLVMLEQENQPFGHFTVRRGKELITDFGSTTPLDTTGSRVKLAYVAESDTVYACYGVGRGVRIRRSRDMGNSWGAASDAVTLEPEDDGGFSSRFSDCAIAPWKNGAAIFTYVEDDSIVVRTVDSTLSTVSSPETIFFSSPADGGGGNLFAPQHTTIATLPGNLPDGGAGSIVQIGFTGTRLVGGSTSTDVYGLYRDANTGTFLGAELIDNTGSGMTSVANGDRKDFVSIVIDPKTGRSLAAYTVAETGGAYNTVYLSLFDLPTKPKKWLTGSDLTVFVKQQTASLVFPARNAADLWDAFSPSLAVTKAGKIFLSVVAGKRGAGGNDFRMYLVGFDFKQQSPIGGLGWFVPPAIKLNDARVFDPRPGTNVVPPNVSTIATDGQLSVYGVFIEGVGQFGEIENRAHYLSRP